MFMCVHYRDDTKRLVRVKREFENAILRETFNYHNLIFTPQHQYSQL